MVNKWNELKQKDCLNPIINRKYNQAIKPRIRRHCMFECVVPVT